MGQDKSKVKDVFTNNPDFQFLKATTSNKIFYIDMGEYLTFGSSFAKNAYSLIKKIQIEQ